MSVSSRQGEIEAWEEVASNPGIRKVGKHASVLPSVCLENFKHRPRVVPATDRTISDVGAIWDQLVGTIIDFSEHGLGGV